MPQQPAITLDSLLNQHFGSAGGTSVDDLVNKYFPAPELPKSQPSFLSRSLEGLGGLFNFGRTVLGSTIGNNLQDQITLGQGLVDTGSKSINDFRSGDPIAGITRIAGYDPEQIRSDWNSSRYGAAFADALIPTAANIGMGHLTKLGKVSVEASPSIDLESHLRNIIPQQQIKGLLPEAGRTYEKPNYIVREDGTTIDVNSPFNQEIADALARAQQPGSNVSFFDRPNRPVIKGLLPERGQTSANGPNTYIGHNGELIVDNPRNSPYFNASEVTNPTAEELGLFGNKPIEAVINETHPGPGIGRGAEDLGLQAKAGSAVELPKKSIVEPWDFGKEPVVEPEMFDLPKPKDTPSWNWKSGTTNPTATDLMLDKIKQFINETKGEADSKVHEQILKALKQGLATNQNLGKEGIQFVTDYIQRVGGSPEIEKLLRTYQAKLDEPIARKANTKRQLPMTPENDPMLTSRPAIQKLMASMGELRNLRAQQEQLYSVERARRIGAADAIKTPGVKGYYEQLSQLKGELPKVDTEKLNLGEDDINSMYQAITDNKYLRPFEKINAKGALLKILTGSEVPQYGEIRLLSEVFGKDFGNSIVNLHGGIGGPINQSFGDLSSATKIATSSIDLSMLLGQALPVTAWPKIWSGAIAPAIKAGGFEHVFNNVMQGIKDSEFYGLAREGGLKLTDSINAHEEAFPKVESSGIDQTLLNLRRIKQNNPPSLSGLLSTSIPKGPRGLELNPFAFSERSYTLYLNKVRMDLFENLMDKWSKVNNKPLVEKLTTIEQEGSEGGKITKTINEGYDAEINKAATEIAHVVNTLTGRGDLRNFGTKAFKTFEKIAPELNNIYFSPRNTAAIATQLNPKFYMTENPIARKAAIRGALGMLAAGGTITGIVQAFTGKKPVDSQYDPTSADFMKAKVGDKTRFEAWGGRQQFIVTGVRELAAINNLVKAMYDQKAPGPYAHTVASVTADFLRKKESPIASFIHDMASGKDLLGNPVKIDTETMRAFTPMFLGDLISVIKEDPDLLPLGIPGLAGGRIQVYGEKKTNPSMQIRMPR